LNKGRNILLIMIGLLLVSVLSFFTLFERSNTTGVVGDVRYIVDSENDGVKTLNFYYVEPGVVKTCTAVETDDEVTFTIEDCDFVYTYNKVTKDVSATSSISEEYPFQTYHKDLFKQIAEGHDRFLKFYQAGIVAVLCVIGGAMIIYAEEIWLFIHRKEDRTPKWKDMNKIKLIGGGVVAVGIVIMILFILI